MDGKNGGATSPSLAELQNSKYKDGRTASESTRMKDSQRRNESVRHSKSVHDSGDILDKKRQEIKEYTRLIRRREREIREIEDS